MPNQRDVAAKANVSSASVSRYLKDPSQLTPRMREKVKNAIDATGYKLDYFARILKTGRSQHIGILLPGNGPFYWEVLQGIQDSLMHSGYFTTTLYTRDIDPNLHNSQEMLTKLLNCNMLEGVIYFPLSSSEDVRIMGELQRFHKHIVVVDRDMGNFGFGPSLHQ